MFRTATALVLILLGVNGLEAGEPILIVPGRGIGPVRLHASPQAVAALWGAARERPAAREGAGYRWYEYPERGAWILARRDRIVKIGVEHALYRTAEGFGVGTRARAVTMAWGDGELERAIPWHERKEAREVDVRYRPDKPPERYYLKYPQRGITFLVDTATDLVMSVFVYPPRPGPR